MSWNEARIALVAEGVEAATEIAPFSEDAKGEAVEVLSFSDGESRAGRDNDLQNLRAWLDGKGFTLVPASSVEFRCKDIHVLVGHRDGLATRLIITFEIGLNARGRRVEWRQFVNELCSGWDLSLVDDLGNIVDLTKFYELLEETFAWDCFLQREAGASG